MDDNGMLCRDAAGELVFVQAGGGGSGVKTKAYITNNIPDYPSPPSRTWTTVKTHTFTPPEKANLISATSDRMLIYNLDESAGSCFYCECDDRRGRVDLQTRFEVFGSWEYGTDVSLGYLYESGIEMESEEEGDVELNLKIGRHVEGMTVFFGYIYGGFQLDYIQYQFNAGATPYIVKNFNVNDIRIVLMHNFGSYTNVYNSST